MANRRAVGLVGLLGLIIAMANGVFAQAPTADDYLDFVRPHFPGKWQVETVASDGSVIARGTIEFQMGPRQRCALSIATGEDATMVSTGIHGYDPHAKCWRVVQFNGDGSMVTMDVVIDKKVLTGGKIEGVTYTHRNTLTKPDGTQEVSDWKATLVDRNTLELQQVSGAAESRLKLRFVRDR